MSSNESEEVQKKEDETSEVHSANSWETADLGDKSRHDKFLRLMGASKKKHHGRFVIGDQDGKHRAKPDEQHRADELEEQYKHSLEHSMAGGKKGHIGLGFHDEDKKPEAEKEEVVDKKEGEGSGDAERTEEKSSSDSNTESKETEKAESEKKDSGERKRESVDESGPEHEEVKKLKFVKSSS